MNRRSFVKALGTSGVLPVFSEIPAQTAPVSRSQVSLNGAWQRHINDKLYDVITVPSSLRPMGRYQLRRDFLLPRLNGQERAFICFEGITYFARVSVNGTELGTMGPYLPYEFEFTFRAKEGNNSVAVEIVDLPQPDGVGMHQLALGVNPGWEAYGGIIRDAYVELRPPAFIENVRLEYQLHDDFGRAECRVRVYVSSAQARSAKLEVTLSHGRFEAARVEKAVQLKAASGNELELTFDVNAVGLWSLENPQLYDLRAVLKTESEDIWTYRTGFREIKTVGREFRLNGEKLILHGVCRHDMWKNQGFTLTQAQREQDMRMIKGLGCNYVRLVHYPHDRQIVRLADQLGLLVSEEPGYWNMDFGTMPRGEIELGFQILEGVIRRDWNSPAVMAWLLSNECTLTVEVLREGKTRCRTLDPIGRLVSAANSMDRSKAKPIFEASGMDFFDQHPYTFQIHAFEKEAEFDGPGKPLTFTEWGGKAIGQSRQVMQRTVDHLLDLIESNELAGHAFWSWQDMCQYSRIDEEMRDGVLESGVVTEGREPREFVYAELKRLCEGRRHEHETASCQAAVTPLSHIPWSQGSTFSSVKLQALAESAIGQKRWAAFNDHMAKFWTKAAPDQWTRAGQKFVLSSPSTIDIAGVTFHVPTIDSQARPLVLTPEFAEMAISVGVACKRVHILGNVTLPQGFPLVGRDGEIVASYTLQYASGTNHEIPLRSGYEVARSNLIFEGTRYDPIATEAQRALIYIRDISREQYQVLLFSIATEPEPLKTIHCRLNTGGEPLAIFAIVAEHA